MNTARQTSIIRTDVESITDQFRDELQQMDGTTVVITGAAGFLCSYFVDVLAFAGQALFSRGCRVVAVDNFQTGLPIRLEHLRRARGIEVRSHDARQPMEIEGSVEWIVHGASIASPVFYRRFPLETIDVNVTGTRLMLELARRGARAMLYLSSSETYGDPAPEAIPTPETYWGNVSFTGPRACYDESKRLAETLCTTYFRLYGTPVKIVRPFNVFGPGQRLDDGRIIPDLLSAALERRPLRLYSDGRATRSFCYVSDAIRAMLRVLFSGADGEAYNIGNDMQETTIGQIAETMSEVAGEPPLPVIYERSADPHYLVDNPQRRCPDLTKLRALQGWTPRVTAREGLHRTLESYREIIAAVPVA
jgi:dTDP-glucose 4,6-dehydratase/UDP-glucuronate decarboxylase